GAFGIGDVALLAGDHERAVERAAPADLDGVADHRRIAWFAYYSMVEGLAALGRPLDELHRAVHRDAFLVSGDQERDRPLRPAAARGEMIECGGERAGDRPLHVDRAAAVERAVGDLAGERRVGPFRLLARRHHVGVTGERE